MSKDIPLSIVIPFLIAIADRDFEKFKEFEQHFVDEYGVETWRDVFDQRVKPALDNQSDRWLLIQWCA